VVGRSCGKKNEIYDVFLERGMKSLARKEKLGKLTLEHHEPTQKNNEKEQHFVGKKRAASYIGTANFR